MVVMGIVPDVDFTSIAIQTDKELLCIHTLVPDRKNIYERVSCLAIAVKDLVDEYNVDHCYVRGVDIKAHNPTELVGVQFGIIAVIGGEKVITNNTLNIISQRHLNRGVLERDNATAAELYDVLPTHVKNLFINEESIHVNGLAAAYWLAYETIGVKV